MKNGQYRPELIAALDQNHDGKLDRSELRLDTPAKRQTVEQLLVAAGVKNPTIRSEVQAPQNQSRGRRALPGPVGLRRLPRTRFPP